MGALKAAIAMTDFWRVSPRCRQHDLVSRAVELLYTILDCRVPWSWLQALASNWGQTGVKVSRKRVVFTDLIRKLSRSSGLR